MRKLTLLLSLVTVFAGSSCGPLAGPQPTATMEPTPTPLVEPPMEFLSTVDERMQDLLDYSGVPGAALAIVHEGEVVWVEGYGMADRKAEIPMEADAVFPVSSISTTISAWGAASLMEDGFLDLDEPVEAYLDGWAPDSEEYDTVGITARRILSHTAGLSNAGYSGIPLDESLPDVEELMQGGVVGVEPLQVVNEPGAVWDYSAGGYALLEYLMEEITEEPFAEYMQREILDPLGMENSRYGYSPDHGTQAAVGHDAAQQPVEPVQYPALAAAGLYSTAGDLAHFLAAAMEGAGGRDVGAGVLSSSTVDMMLNPAANTWSAFQYGERGRAGLGYALYTLRNNNLLVMQFSGGQGYRSLAAMIPGQGEGLVVLTNSDRGEEFSMRLLCAWSAWAVDNVPEMCIQVQ